MATLQELENGLRKAHAAGNTEHARIFAREIRRLRQAPDPSSPDYRSPNSDLTRDQRQAQLAAMPKPEESLSFVDRAMLTVEPFAREAALGGRAMLEGIGSTLGIVSDPVAGAVGLPSAREGFSSLADLAGAPKPQTASERIGSDVTSALTGAVLPIGLGGSLAKAASPVARGVGATLADMPTTQLAGAAAGSSAASATREAGGGQGAQLAAGLIGGLSPAAVKTTGSMALRGAARGGGQGRQAMEQSISDFRAVGANPSVGQATGNQRTQGLESLLAGGPTSSGVMSRAAERQAESIGSGLQRLADDFMPNASAERAGRAIERGADTFANNVRATKKALYWQADRFIPESTALPLSRTQMALAELTTPNQGAMATTGSLINPRIAQIAQNVSDDLAANGGAMPYAAVKELRSRIGEELSDFALAPDRPTAQYKRLYAALSQDLEEAARQQGPQAAQAIRRANNYTRASADRLEQVQRVVDKNGGPEKVYNAVMSGTRDGGTTLRAVMQSLPKDGQRALTAAVIKRMGMATPGAQDAAGEVFSANTFLTNWNRVSPEAKRALFDRHGPKFAANMDKIARVADRIKSGSQVFANPSGTANRAAAFGYVGSLVLSLMSPATFAGLAGGGVAANVAARAMTNPRFVNWLAEATRMPISALPQQVNVLKGMARSTGDEEIAEVAGALEEYRAQDHGNAP